MRPAKRRIFLGRPNNRQNTRNRWHPHAQPGDGLMLYARYYDKTQDGNKGQAAQETINESEDPC